MLNIIGYFLITLGFFAFLNILIQVYTEGTGDLTLEKIKRRNKKAFKNIRKFHID